MSAPPRLELPGGRAEDQRRSELPGGRAQDLFTATPTALVPVPGAPSPISKYPRFTTKDVGVLTVRDKVTKAKRLIPRRITGRRDRSRRSSRPARLATPERSGSKKAATIPKTAGVVTQTTAIKQETETSYLMGMTAGASIRDALMDDMASGVETLTVED